MENKTKEASELYRVGCRQVSANDYEAGIATLRQANVLDSTSRPIEVALFNALVQFAKLIVDFEPKRARYLLEEAAQLSPLNLTLEIASKFLSDRILECALADCRLRVQVLRDNGQIHDALKLVSAVADQFQIHDDPLIEEIRSTIWTGFGGASGSTPKVEKLSEQDALPVDTTGSDAFAPRELWHSLLKQTEHAWTLVENWKVHEKIRRTLQVVAAEQQTLSTQIVIWRDHLRSAFSRLPKAYKLGAGVIGLLLIVASTVVSTSLRNPPVLPSVGTATTLSSVTLLREPSTSSRASGNLKIGQAVEILTPLPAMTPDAWALVRFNDDKQTSGYVQLQSLDHIKTGDPQFDLWHAMLFLSGASKPEELETRLANVDQMLQSEPFSHSRETGEMRLRVSKAYADLASESMDNPESARAALVKAEAYLSGIEGVLQLSDDAGALRESIHKSQVGLGDATDKPVSVPPAIRKHTEEVRIMRLANNAYAQGTYETSAEYSAQVLRMNGGNLEAKKLLDASRQAQKDLEAAITGR